MGGRGPPRPAARLRPMAPEFRRRRDALGDDDPILNGGTRSSPHPSGPARPACMRGWEYPLVRALPAEGRARGDHPDVPLVLGTDLHAYFCEGRVSAVNPKIGDTIRWLCLDGSSASRNSSFLDRRLAGPRSARRRSLRLNRRLVPLLRGTTDSGRRPSRTIRTGIGSRPKPAAPRRIRWPARDARHLWPRRRGARLPRRFRRKPQRPSGRTAPPRWSVWPLCRRDRMTALSPTSRPASGKVAISLTVLASSSISNT